MDKPLRVLVVDDSEDDALLLVRHLRQYGYAPTYERVDTAAALSAALEKQSWDIVISDYVMPRFSGLAVLKLLRERNPDLPCIITSGKISEDTAVAAMKAGAYDYIMKDNLKRLGPAIEREIQEAANRREQKKAAEALRQSEEQLRIMKKIDQLKDEFIGFVSHEMRSPLTVVVGALSTVLTEGEKLAPQETRQLIEDALYEAEALSNVLANLLELAKAQANRLQLFEEPVSIKEAINEAINKIRRQAATHQFVAEVSPGLPTVTADPVRLERILYNLLDNAVKYSPSGSEIRVLARRDGKDVVIGVCDQGLGISVEDQGKLFKAFQRLDFSNPAIKGTGLGLVVCQRLVEAQHGRIWVESKPGQGSTFYFTLPAFETRDE